MLKLNFRMGFRRHILVFLSLLLIFTIALPTEVMAIWPFDTKPQPSILPAQQVDIGQDQATLDGSSSQATHSEKKVERVRDHEDTSKRTANTSTFVNKDGTKTMEYSPLQRHFQSDGKWLKINNSLKGDVTYKSPRKLADQTNQINSLVPENAQAFDGMAGNFKAQFRPFADGIEIVYKNKTMTLKPVGAQNVKPVLRSEGDRMTKVFYKDVWPGVDAEYELRGEAVKETIIIKHKTAQSSFNFEMNGGKLIAHPIEKGALAVEGIDPGELTISLLTVDVQGRGVISETVATQSPTETGMAVAIDGAWLASQPDKAFPIAIDPSFSRGAGSNYVAYKSDGYGCNSSVCYPNTGTLNDYGWKHWRTMFRIPMTELAGKNLIDAGLNLYLPGGGGGTGDGRWIYTTWASCLGFNCIGPGAIDGASIGSNGWVNANQAVKWMMDNNVLDGWMIMWGEEGEYYSYKAFNPNIVMYLTYDNPTPVPTQTGPDSGQVMVHTQPTLKTNPVVDADGPTKYHFSVSSNSGGGGAVINSGWIDGTQWTVPDGILQDGTTYYWRVSAKDSIPNSQASHSGWRPFKIDLRTGKDSTQAYDTVGPIGVDLATGNATLEAGTHTMNALGGKIGLNMTYDSPAKTQKGLTGQYWNVPSGYNGDVPAGDPALIRNDPDVNFNWPNGTSPGSGIGTDWFYARWKGYFTAPTTGSYQFGATQDDSANISVNGQNFGGCYGGTPCYNGGSISLQAGQTVPIDIKYIEATGDGYLRVFVKGAVSEQIIPRDWLQTEVKSSASQYGLAGRYYTDDGSHNLAGAATDPNRFMMARNDSKLAFEWGSGGPATGMQSDNFMAKWTGYITVPSLAGSNSASYTFGKVSDDGVRVKVNNGLFGSEQTVLDSWNYTTGEVWGGATTLNTGTQIPITIEYYEANGPAYFRLLMKGPGLKAEGEEVPVKWLTPKTTALPDAWRLGVDVDGNVGYERLRVAGQNIILEDSTRATHEYAWTGGGFKPPVNEDGQLTRNPDNTYSLIDTDGRTYLFDKEGKLVSLTTPTDDRNPASLKYEYSGDPSRLIKISDGVTSSRYGTLHYKGYNEDGNCSVPGGFNAAPDGMLCAFKTTDGDVTKLYYKAGQLSRIEKPGAELADYGYDNLGRITSIRDSIANDTIVASVRADDATLLTEVSYDNLGRASAVKAPGATAGATRTNHTFEYLPSATQMHIVGAPEPNGFSKRVEYDSLLRTTKETDVANLSSMQEWDVIKDLQKSSTDATGLKSTTIYDSNDRPIENYGPAPSAWYGADRKPLVEKVNDVPKTSTGYDEGIVGPAVSWYNYKAQSDSTTAPGTGGTLTGSPRLFTTGLNSATPGVLSADIASPAVSYESGFTGVGFRTTGKLYLPNGTFWVNAQNTEGIRVWIDDNLVMDSWQDTANRAVTGGSFTVANNEAKRFRVDTYRKNGSTGPFSLSLRQDGGFGWTTDWSSWLKPDYNLKTSQTAYDSQLGNVTTTTTYNKPEYGLADKTTLDPTGLNLQTSSTYETPGATGSFLRQTSKTLPGGGTTTYQHYTATDTRDDPCTTGVETTNQAGMPKGKVEADPDGAGPQTSRTSETIYNASGEAIATRYNNDDWTCTEYDNRGRVQRTIIPALGSKPSRTIVNDYAKDGNPLVTTTTDDSGTIRVENDLLGRTVKYIDAKGKVTENTYDAYGKLTQRISPIGTETYEYDTYDRLTKHKLDSVTFATVTYDQYSRIANVQYPAGMSLSNISRDTLGRENGNTYTLTSSQTLSDSVNRYVSGDIQNGTELGVSKSYQYDKAGRLTNATIGSNTYSYEFGTQDPSCPVIVGYDAGKEGNRTKLNVNGQSTGYCYDKADRLTGSSDPTLTNAQYDTHGNTISLGDATHKTEFDYDASDRNTAIKSGTKETLFTRDVQNRIIGREHKQSGTTTSNVGYGFTGSSDTPDFLLDASGNLTQKYLTLPGDVLVTIKTNSQSAGATTFSLPNLHGDVMATVNADGVLIATHMTGPFGEVLPNQTNPANTAPGTTWSYVGQHEKLTDTETSPIQGGIIQMGARVYIPVLGRFLSVDSVEGGTPNNYVYALDSVNEYDLDGRMIATRGNRDAAKKGLDWLWKKRNEFVAWKDKNLPWFNDTVSVLAMARGGKISGKMQINTKASLLAESAAKLGFTKRVPAQKLPFDSHGQVGFQKGNKYITPDIGTNGTSHKGGVWKMYQGKERLGTYDAKLNRIGD